MCYSLRFLDNEMFQFWANSFQRYVLKVNKFRVIFQNGETEFCQFTHWQCNNKARKRFQPFQRKCRCGNLWIHEFRRTHDALSFSKHFSYDCERWNESLPFGKLWKRIDKTCEIEQNSFHIHERIKTIFSTHDWRWEICPNLEISVLPGLIKMEDSDTQSSWLWRFITQSRAFNFVSLLTNRGE